MANEIVLIPLSELTSIIQIAVQNALNQKPNNDDSLLNSKEVKSLLKISDVTLCKWRKQKKIPFMRVDNKIYYRNSEILKMLQQRA